MKRRAATIDDVAQLAGVSNMTVSRVVNGAAHVSEETRQRVVSAMADLAYRPNSLAKGMRSNTTRTIGFILPDLTNSTNALVAQTVEQTMATHGYRTLLASTAYDVATEQRFLEEFQAKLVDGIIVFLTDESSVRSIELVDRSSVPVVVIDRDVPAAANFVLTDHRTAMREIVGHLVGLGHERIGLIVPSVQVRPGRERHEAYRRALLDHGLPSPDNLVRALGQTFDEQEGYRAAMDLLGRRDRPTALIVGANLYLPGAVQATRELSIDVPSQLSLVGSDENRLSALIDPPMTIIWRDQRQIGERAADLLLEHMRQPATRSRTIVVDSSIIYRASCAAAPKLRALRGVGASRRMRPRSRKSSQKSAGMA